MRRICDWILLCVSLVVFTGVLLAFLWQNVMNILALMIMGCLIVAIIRHAQELGLLE